MSIWPPPRSFTASGPQLALSPDITIHHSFASSRLERIKARYLPLLTAAAVTTSAPSLHAIHLNVTDFNERLDDRTCYNYSLHVSDDAARIESCSIFGAAYALEGLVQLAGRDGMLPHSAITIHDAPQYGWRGLMIDVSAAVL